MYQRRFKNEKDKKRFFEECWVKRCCGRSSHGGTRLAHSAEETWKWKGQIFCSRGCRFYEGAEDFGFMVDKYTNGRVKMDLHQAGEIVPAGQVFDAAGQGIIDFGMGCPCLAKSKAYGAQLFCDSPGFQSPIEKVIWYYNAGGKEMLVDIIPPKIQCLSPLLFSGHGGNLAFFKQKDQLHRGHQGH